MILTERKRLNAAVVLIIMQLQANDSDNENDTNSWYDFSDFGSESDLQIFIN